VSSSFDFPSVDRLTTGTVGPPGQRVFYLQARSGPQVVTLRLEKAQVAALAQYLADQLNDLPALDATQLPTDLDLEEPVVPEWIVGSLGVSLDEATDRITLVAEELVPGSDDEDEDEDEEPDPLGPQPGVARFAVTRAQVAAFIVRASQVVAAGRPPCPLCGRPLDPEGHVCVKTNGHAAH
jgi:uncharacterized repeat protein (TIGR03847 family)